MYFKNSNTSYSPRAKFIRALVQQNRRNSAVEKVCLPKRNKSSAKYLSAERLFAKLSKFLQYMLTLWVPVRKWQWQKFNRHLQNSNICCKISFWIHTRRESKPQINTLPKTKLEVQKDSITFILSENIIHFPIYINAGRQTVGTNTRTYVQIFMEI